MTEGLLDLPKILTHLGHGCLLRRHDHYGREMLDVSRYQSLEALSKGFDEHIGDRALTRLTSTLSLYVMGPKVKSTLRVLEGPRLEPFHPYPLEKLLLELKITAEFGCQLDVGNRTDEQAFREVPHQTLGGGESKLRIVLANIEENRAINDPSHDINFAPRLPAVLQAPHRCGVAEVHVPLRISKHPPDRV